MSDFKPFADDSAVLGIEGISLENGRESIAIHGSVDVRRDKAGLATAKHLRDALAAVVDALEAAGDLPDEAPAPRRSTKTFDQPFGGSE